MEPFIGTFSDDGATWTFRRAVDGLVTLVEFIHRDGELTLRAHGVIVERGRTMHWFDNLGHVAVICGDDDFTFDGDGLHVELSKDDGVLDYYVELKDAALVVEGSCRKSEPRLTHAAPSTI
jgi:hypothetical protein